MIELVESARNYLGVRFVHQGRSRRGLDCCGLVVRAALDIGLEVRDCQGYANVLTGGELLRGVLDHCDKIAVPERGCIALFHATKGQYHIAIVTETEPCLYVIHAYAPLRKVVEHNLPANDSDIYASQIHLEGFYAWRKCSRKSSLPSSLALPPILPSPGS